MKKRATAKKPAAGKSAAKKSVKSTKAEKPAPRMAERTPERAAAGGKYTPTPIQGIGWAPFRYPA
jgi:hypothetical protein